MLTPASLTLFLISTLLIIPSSTFASPFPTFPKSVLTTRSASANATCGIGSFDFSSLTAGKDWVGLSYDYSEIYYLGLCRNVTNLWCTLNQNTASVQLCQVSSGDTSATYNLMGSDVSTTEWSFINGKDAGDGVRFQAANGDGGGCPRNRPRVTIGNLVCGNTTGVISSIVEGPTCTYTFTIPTPTLCNRSHTEGHRAGRERN